MGTRANIAMSKEHLRTKELSSKYNLALIDRHHVQKRTKTSFNCQ